MIDDDSSGVDGCERDSLPSIASGCGMYDLADTELIYRFDRFAILEDYLDGLLTLHFAPELVLQAGNHLLSGRIDDIAAR